MLAVRTPSGEWQPIRAPGSSPASACGLATDGTNVYCAYTQDDASHIAVWDVFAPRFVESIPLPTVIDVHALVLDGEHVIVASTGSDEVVRVNLADGDCDILWRAGSAPKDTHHLSGLLMHEGRLLSTAFGPRLGRSWADAVDGYIYDLSSGVYLARGIYQPHSPASHEGSLYFCESPRGFIRSLYGAVQFVAGYARGLVFTGGDSYAAGCSVARRGDGVHAAGYSNPADPGARAGTCAVYFGSLSDYAFSRESLEHLGAEIYDILAIG